MALRGPDLSSAADAIGTTVRPTPAEILLGASMWLAAERDDLDDDLTLARSRFGLGEGGADERVAIVALPLASLERLHCGLACAVALLDGLAIDPMKILHPRVAEPTIPTARALQ